MGDLFNQYNSQIQGVLESIKNRLTLCRDNPNSPDHVSHVNELDGFISSAEETLRQMELEARSYSDSSSYDRLEQVLSVKNIRAFLKDASDCSRSLHTDLERRELLGEVSQYGNTRQYKTLTKNREMLDKGLMFIKTSCDAVTEAEKIGYDASRNLSQQRNVITNVSSELARARFSLSGADEYLCCLLKQGRLNRVVLNVVKVAIGATVGIILAIRLVKFVFFFSRK
ncbi:vesicle transport protein [Theileria orientalis strain Shintoku]|uniref:Vesicle transport protein n=1 Tax=Theileria orientalis strain Shintoku TaxID=869250 RepID=J7MGM6_THEOR|nr:vesicle transport protein [Theileria orientalis strain Shintoku]PVC50306.1 vesicle transport protein [Theileria orientalis]BAM38611.1 vesicle transport protein [Theileria orientalis strain Shintoku]|eukprot:XP_009688912.1 vesicle transport protein [Theileria orientalis strain Shintoku]